jgi:GTP pyrophosphokinase
MVFVVSRAGDDELCTGLRPEEAARLRDAIEFVREPYAGKQVPTGQDAMDFSRDVVAALASLKADADTRIAGMLFELAVVVPEKVAAIEVRFGKEVADMVTSIRQLMRLHEGMFARKDTDRTKTSAASQMALLVRWTSLTLGRPHH